MTHFIRQQYFDVELKGSESDGFALQHRLSDLFYAQLLPAIEKALDQCPTWGKHIVIDRLDIDAGTIEFERIERDLAPAIIKTLTRDIEINSAISQASRSNFMDTDENLWEVFIHFLIKGNLPWSYRLPAGKSLEEVISELLQNEGILNSSRILADRIEVKLQSPNAAKRLALQFSEHFTTLLRQKISPDLLKVQVDTFDHTRDGNLWEVFIHFLLNGNLPGLYKLPPEKSLEDALTELLNEDDTKTNHSIPVARIAEVFKSPFAANRMAFQFSESFLLKLLERISPDILVELKSILRVSENLSFTPDQARLVRKFVLEKTISQLFSGKYISKVEIAKQVIDDLQISTDLHPLVTKVFEQAWPEIKMPANELSDTIERLIPLGKNLETAILQRDLISSYPNLSGIKVAENKAPSSEAPAIEKMLPNEIVDGIYIDNAGLVLLHPFLPRFFEALRISKEEEILQPERSLSLLYYLTTGQTKIPEYELVLPKILCEFPLLMPVPSDFKITENEINEASALLEAVIKHWEVLRNTTPDGLRGTFLLRPGKLSQKEDGDWLLQVESRTFDVLLEHLPWGISMIKLPWMKNMLWVEWSF